MHNVLLLARNCTVYVLIIKPGLFFSYNSRSLCWPRFFLQKHSFIKLLLERYRRQGTKSPKLKYLLQLIGNSVDNLQRTTLLWLMILICSQIEVSLIFIYTISVTCPWAILNILCILLSLMILQKQDVSSLWNLIII